LMKESGRTPFSLYPCFVLGFTDGETSQKYASGSAAFIPESGLPCCSGVFLQGTRSRRRKPSGCLLPPAHTAGSCAGTHRSALPEFSENMR